MGTKVLILGLDGATPELIDRWVGEEKLPYLKQIMQKGVALRIVQKTLKNFCRF